MGERGAPLTLGLAFDLLPAVLFLHVFLAFPDGRLEWRAERALVAAGYSAAVGLQLAKMLLGGGGPDNLLSAVTEPVAANTVEDVQLVTLSAISLGGIGLLAARRLGAGPPLRRSVALLVDSFGLGLVMMAALLLAGAFSWPAFETIRNLTFGVIGLAPLAFLIGLLSSRLARSSVGDLLVELQTDPAPADLPRVFARALRDPVADRGVLAARVPKLGRPRRPGGRAADRRLRAGEHPDRPRRRAPGGPRPQQIA